MSSIILPIIDIGAFLKPEFAENAALEECRKAADALITFGALLVRDPRVSEGDNSAFLDLIEDYFAQGEDILRNDERPELGYQVGVTLENTEKPKCAVHEPCLSIIASLEPSERPLDISQHQPDPKCRFFWKMGELPPYKTAFPSLNAPNVIPEEPSIRERWVPTMEKWGTSMKNAVQCIAEMVAIGLGLPRETFINASRYGPHLLAPTASDLTKYGVKDTILAGFHTDLNFLTIHGRSRYPGLNIWARNTGKRIPVVFPETNSCLLLVQAGKQLEHLSGGLIKAGYHEVVVNDATLDAVRRRKITYPDRPSIRISSTFFYHLSSDFDLAPIPCLADRAMEIMFDGSNSGGIDESKSVYEPMKVGQQVQDELRHISLMA